MIRDTLSHLMSALLVVGACNASAAQARWDTVVPPLPKAWTELSEETLNSNAPLRRLKTLTGARGQPKGVDFGDPSPPVVTKEGVRVTTTGGLILSWSRKRYGVNAGEAFLKGLPADVEILKIAHDDGTLMDDAGGEDIWDPTFECAADDTEILYGSVMDPPSWSASAHWPDDAWSRRTYRFTKQNGVWARDRFPIFAPVPGNPTWIDHTYGHSFLSSPVGKKSVFYEKVISEENGLPWATAIYSREMLDDSHAAEEERLVFQVGSPAYPATKRSFGGTLVEGPRAVKVGNGSLISFSSGDYESDDYGINFLWISDQSKLAVPYLDETGTDLKNFNEEIERVQPMSWGAGRAALFKMDGTWWVLFHGIATEKGPIDPDTAHRNIYLAPVMITLHGNLAPDIRIYAE